MPIEGAIHLRSHSIPLLHVVTFLCSSTGGHGLNHGIELHQDVIDYANERLQYFMKDAIGFDHFEFAVPNFVQGKLFD